MYATDFFSEDVSVRILAETSISTSVKLSVRDSFYAFDCPFVFLVDWLESQK